MNTLTRWTPFPGKLMNEMLRDLAGPRGESSWSPRIDLKETAEGYVVTAEVPGLDPKAIEITLKDKTLTLKGEKTREEKQEEETLHVLERSYGSFQRTFTFPVPIEGDSVEARSQNGILSISIKKTPEVRPRRIEISDSE